MAASRPAHTCRFPTDLLMSFFNVWTTALPIVVLMPSPNRIGWSLRFLSKGMNLLAKNASRESVWSDSTYYFFGTLASAIHISVELWPKLLDVSILLQPLAFIPEGPDPPLVRRAVFRMTSDLCIHTLSYV